MFNPLTLAASTNLRFAGIPYANLPDTSVAASGTIDGYPYWTTRDGHRIVGVKDVPGGGYGGFQTSGISWSGGSGVFTKAAPTVTAPVDYAEPNVPSMLGMDVNPMDAQLLFSGSGNLGQAGIGPLTVSTPAADETNAPAITQGSGGGVSPWLIVAVIVGAVWLLQK